MRCWYIVGDFETVDSSEVTSTRLVCDDWSFEVYKTDTTAMAAMGVWNDGAWTPGHFRVLAVSVNDEPPVIVQLGGLLDAVGMLWFEDIVRHVRNMLQGMFDEYLSTLRSEE